MRILHVIQEMRTGGAERIVVPLAHGAMAHGHNVALAAAPGPLAEELGIKRFPMPLVRRRPSAIPGAALALRRALHAWNADLVHCHNPGMAAATALATLRGRHPHALVSVHGVPDEDWASATRVLRISGLPAVACGPGVEGALADGGYAAIATIPNAVGPAPQPAERATLERDWGLDPKHTLIVSVGRLVPQKNQALAVRALAHVPAATLVIVGEGPLADELKGEAADAGVADRVVFAGLRPDARAILGAADVVVLPSVWEGLPLVALEALAAGRPIVATAVRGLRELLTDEVDALLVEANDEHALAKALRRLLTDPGLARRLGENAHARASDFSEEKMVESYLDLYSKLARR
jgi:glycosyltransferase involved in cell wall biosynthesis